MNKSTTRLALILSLLAASWVCLGCRPVRYHMAFVNEHDQPAVIEVLEGEEDALQRSRIVVVLGPRQRTKLVFSDGDRIHSRTARDLQGRPLRVGAGGRVQGLEGAYGAEVWQGLGRLRIGLGEGEVREIFPSLSPVEPGDETGESHAVVGSLEVTFVGESLASWCLEEPAEPQR